MHTPEDNICYVLFERHNYISKDSGDISLSFLEKDLSRKYIMYLSLIYAIAFILSRMGIVLHRLCRCLKKTL